MSKEISGKDRTQSNGDEDDTTQPPPPTAHSERSPLLINNKTSRTGSSNPSIPFYSASNGTSGHHKRAVSSSFGNTTGATSPSGLTNQDQYLYVNQLLTVINDRRTRFQQNFSLVILLLVNVLERFAYYGLICNYLLYLNKEPFFWESFNASLLLFVFIGVTNLSGLVGGWVADSYIGKYTTICISFIVYIIGYAAYPLLSISETALPGVCSANGSVVDWSLINVTAARLHRFDPLSKDSDKSIFAESCSWLIIITIFLIGIGVGFVKANLGPFGADQVLSRGQPMVFKYFNWLYWSINLGSLASFSLLAYLQQNVNFLIGYLIPFVALVLSFLLFLIGSFSYIKKEAEFPVLSTVIKVFYEAFQSVKRRKILLKQKQRAKALLTDDENEYASESEQSFNFERTSYRLDSSSSSKNISWLDNAKIRYGGRFDDNQVDDVKSLKRIVILFALLIPYWLVYFQIETTYLIQGFHMKLIKRIDESGTTFMIPAAWLSIVDQIVVLIMIPILDRFVYPYLRRRYASVTLFESTRLVLGMCLSALSIIVAGLLESERISIIQADPIQNTVVQVIGGTTYYAADLNILWQIPQYTLLGLGEVFCSVSCLYFAYSAAPKSMQSIIMGLFYFASGLGSMLNSLVLLAFKSFIFSSNRDVDDINCATCHLNYYFYFIGVLQLVGVVVFIAVDATCAITRTKMSLTVTNFNRYLYDEETATGGGTGTDDSENESGGRRPSAARRVKNKRQRTVSAMLNTNKLNNSSGGGASNLNSQSVVNI